LFKSLSNLANLGNIIKQAQEMGGRLKQLNEQMKAERTKGASGGGLVEVEMNGLAEVLSVSIDPDLIARGDREMIEDLLPAAFNAAQAKAKKLHTDAMQSLTGGLGIPGLQEALGEIGAADTERNDTEQK
jgi:DNA-binding YbaB/EbfC family protein